MKNNKTKMMVMTSIFSAFITIGGFIKIPLPNFEYITLRLMFVIMAGFILGEKWGAIASAIHVILGLVGFPVFASGGGLGYVLKPSFGYIIGFISAGYISGYVYRKIGKTDFKSSAIAAVAAMLSMYVIGLAYKFMILSSVSDVTEPIYILMFASLPIEIPGDLLLALAAAFANVKFSKIISRHPELKI